MALSVVADGGQHQGRDVDRRVGRHGHRHIQVDEGGGELRCADGAGVVERCVAHKGGDAREEGAQVLHGKPGRKHGVEVAREGEFQLLGMAQAMVGLPVIEAVGPGDVVGMVEAAAVAETQVAQKVGVPVHPAVDGTLVEPVAVFAVQHLGCCLERVSFRVKCQGVEDVAVGVMAVDERPCAVREAASAMTAGELWNGVTGTGAQSPRGDAAAAAEGAAGGKPRGTEEVVRNFGGARRGEGERELRKRGVVIGECVLSMGRMDMRRVKVGNGKVLHLYTE